MKYKMIILIFLALFLSVSFSSSQTITIVADKGRLQQIIDKCKRLE